MAHAIRNLETRWEDPGLLGYEYTSFKKRVFLSELQGNVRLKTMSLKKTKSGTVWIQMFFTNLDKARTVNEKIRKRTKMQRKCRVYMDIREMYNRDGAQNTPGTSPGLRSTVPAQVTSPPPEPRPKGRDPPVVAPPPNPYAWPLSAAQNTRGGAALSRALALLCRSHPRPPPSPATVLSPSGNSASG